MKAMILGSSGFLGEETSKLFQQHLDDVIIVSRHPKRGTISIDLSDPLSVLKNLDKFKPSIIVNCAVVADFNIESTKSIYAVNSLLPAVISQWCIKNDAHFIQVSGSLVYGDVECCDLNLALNPMSNYAKTKWLAEEMILTSGCRFSSVRFGGIFGVNGPDHLGLNQAIRNAKNNILPKVFAKGSAKRNYIFVQDAAEVLLFCAQNQMDGIFLSGGRQTLTVSQMYSELCDVYFPGQCPMKVAGKEAKDQIVKVSPELPSGRLFKAALMLEK